MDILAQDIRYGVRRLIATPAFSIIVILTLALGIGGNTAIFSVVNAILLRPLPYAEPDRLVTIYHFYPSLNDMEAPVSAPGYRDYREHTRSFESVAVQTGWNVNLTGAGEPERLRGSRVSQDFFKVYRTAASLGRTLLPEEDAPGRNKVVVLSHGLWQRLYGGRADVVGQRMQLNGEPYEIVGVMPRDFRDFWNRRTELWTPLALAPDAFVPDNYTNEYLALSARLKPGVQVAGAAREMTAFANQLKKDNPAQFGRSWTLRVKTLGDVATGRLRPALLVLLGAVGFVLLIACANVANLLLARAAARSREIAVRAALGAQRIRIVRQLLTESVLLSLTGGALGLLIAYAGVRAFARMDQRTVPFAQDVTIDGNVLVFTLLIALATGILFGLAPALQSLRAGVQQTLRSEGRGTTTDRSGQAVRHVLVVAEIALALTLLTGAGLLVRSFARLQGVDPGFEPRNLLTFNMALPAIKYTSDTTRTAFFDAALQAVSRVPGVEGVGATSTLPFSGEWATSGFDIEGYQPPEGQPGPWGDFRVVSPGFQKAMRIPLLRGRFIEETDRRGSPNVIVIDEEFVRRYFANEDPIGKRVTFGEDPGGNPEWITIVGVVGHTKHEGLDAENRIQMYVSHTQMPGVTRLSFVVRTAGDPAAYAARLREAIRSVDRDQPISDVRTMDDLITTSMGQRRLSMILIALFAGVAVVLASLGIYGVMSQLVSQRQRELGVRMALGADAARVLGLVLRQGMTLAAAGVAIGFAGSFALTRLLRAQLFAVKPNDPAVLAAVVVLLTCVAFVATVVPAARAARLDPVRALRQE